MEKEVQRIAVLHVHGMPRVCRARVEQAMFDVITSEPMLAAPGADALEASWCTKWQPSCIANGAVDCRQVLSGTGKELDIFSGVLDLMAGEYGFKAYVELVG
ncbi:MAG: hypothetical protein Q4A82_05775 [Corynebacterium sp.]|nr:hypothetical protein [Corynebacterium sp.]